MANPAGPRARAQRRVTSLTRRVLAQALRITSSLEPAVVVRHTEEALVPAVCDAVVVYRASEEGLRPVHVQRNVPDHLVTYDRGGPLSAAMADDATTQLLQVPDARALAAVLPPSVVEQLPPELSTPSVVAVVPMVHEHDRVGAVVAVTGGPERLDDERVRMLEVVSDVLATALVQAEAFVLGLAVQGALAEASTMDDVPAVPGYEVATVLDPVTPGSPVGGDWVDVLPLGERVAFAIGDVVGHGIPAATWMTEVRNVLRAYLVEGHDPATCLDLVNGYAEVAARSQPATVLVGDLRPDDGTVRFSRAGHPPPIVAGRRLAIAETSPDPPLGTIPGHRHALRQLTLRPGELLMTYTDGLVERRDRDLGDAIRELGEEASTWAVDRADELVRMLRQRVRADVGRIDDVAALVIGRAPDRVDRLVEAVDLDVHAMAALRKRVQRWLEARGVVGMVNIDVGLALSELGANAIDATTAADQFGVAVALDDQRVTVSVTNVGPSFEIPTGAIDPLAVTGRGLRMLRRASDRLEVSHDEGITTVSCVFLREA